jgi:hypothetical protein
MTKHRISGDSLLNWFSWVLSKLSPDSRVAPQPLFADRADTIRQYPFAPATSDPLQPGQFVLMESGGSTGKIVVRV